MLKTSAPYRSEGLFGPSVLLHDLGLLLRGEVVLDIEELANFLNALALDQRSDLGAGKLKQRLDVQVIGGHDNFEQHFLVHIDEVGVPLVDHLSHVS